MEKNSIQTLKITATEDTQSNDSIGTEQGVGIVSGTGVPAHILFL